MAVGTALRFVDVMKRSRNLSPPLRPEGFRAQSAATSVSVVITAVSVVALAVSEAAPVPTALMAENAVVAGGAGGKAGVGVARGGAAGVGHEVGPARAAIGRNLDPVARDGGAAVAGRRVPGEVDRGRPAGRCREARRGAGRGAGADDGAFDAHDQRETRSSPIDVPGVLE